ncbi:MAG: hypothetical protein ACE5EU_04940 [Paracoccaceae bacterium]
MRLAVPAITLIAALGFASVVQAQCEKCPEGFTFWHSKEACLADDGSGAMTEPLYWKEDLQREMATLYGVRLGGRTGAVAGPTGDR